MSEIEIPKSCEVVINGKVMGVIKDYNPHTSIITYKKYGRLRRIWRQILRLFS